VLVVKPHDQAGETATEDLALLVQPGRQGGVFPILLTPI
jgi:hypothetical protein